MSITLKRLETTDRKVLAQLANNKKIWDQVRDLLPHPYTLKDADFFIELTQKEDPEQTFGILKNGELCGVVGLVMQNDVYRKTAEIGYWIGEEFWGQGIATKAVALITDYGFQELDLIRLYAGIFDYNKASMQVLEKNGFVMEGISRNAIIKNNRVCDEHRYAKLKDDL